MRMHDFQRLCYKIRLGAKLLDKYLGILCMISAVFSGRNSKCSFHFLLALTNPMQVSNFGGGFLWPKGCTWPLNQFQIRIGRYILQLSCSTSPSSRTKPQLPTPLICSCRHVGLIFILLQLHFLESPLKNTICTQNLVRRSACRHQKLRHLSTKQVVGPC